MTENQDPDFESMSYAELAEWQYAHREELDDEFERGEYEPVEVEISPNLEVTRSFRLPAIDAELIDQAVERSGLSRSEWIRDVLLAAAKGEGDSPVSKVDLQQALELLHRVENLVDPAHQHVAHRQAS
ncbi:ribbon-helix-helix protein, CopG family [Saccharopolyspora dendranthemae]|uniref:Ribbon-helix-helix CopG family protein n=1 Tax=Saccharopolyspora dendranthemae TaxID=1181886 RepID=A0A561U2X2_9PSEU|nr:ribbon-helix-helix protein, CopG family [Saccharopolyspora dendranthemae]TWF93707.1 ribbon-helix-helix CopG family protein [Saccharopolyspora dendranthemae]